MSIQISRFGLSVSHLSILLSTKHLPLPHATTVPGLQCASNKRIDPGVMLACHGHPSAEACWAHHLDFFTKMIHIHVQSESLMRWWHEDFQHVKRYNLPFPSRSNSGISLSLVRIKADCRHWMLTQAQWAQEHPCLNSGHMPGILQDI